jgi:3-deoxy-D-manno-octulosonic-acid transferase
MTVARARTRPLSLMAYRAAAGLASPFAPGLLRARARMGKEDPARLGERLGRPSVGRPEGPLIWMHGASVGEATSLLPMARAVIAERPDLAILITSGTRASADVLAPRLTERLIHQYAPIDTPRAVARFLNHWRPHAALFAESELWPNLVLSAKAAGVRLALVSARMTERSASAWRRQASLVRAMLQSFDLVLPQDAASELRLAALGARISGRLNLKRAGDTPVFDAEELARLETGIGERQVVAAVSTHAGDEEIVAQALRGLSPAPLLVIAPRHPARAAEIVQALTGFRIARRSCEEPLTATTEVYLADTLGELGLFLKLADVVVMGGGFDPGVGGHNPLEAARLARAVVSGPCTANHAETFAEMASAGAALIVDDPAGLGVSLRALLADRRRWEAMNRAAKAYADQQCGQLDEALHLLRPLLPVR